MNIILYICVYSLDDELCLADSELVINPNTFQTGLDLDLYQPLILPALSFPTKRWDKGWFISLTASQVSLTNVTHVITPLYDWNNSHCINGLH